MTRDEYIKGLPSTEKRAYMYEVQLRGYIQDCKGRYLQGDDGSMHVNLDGSRIPLNFDRNNRALANVMIEACGVSTLEKAAQAAIQRLQVHGSKHSSCIRLRRFSAMSQDNLRIYVPIQDGSLLKISAENIETVLNGDNEDAVWVEHPCGNPFAYVAEDPKRGLADFERLVVETQACKFPGMKWFIAMHEGFFPFVREECPARFIAVHTGPSQRAGKTSGAQRFTLLQGLGEVKGDYSVAALSNQGDIGLLVMDNKEQANLDRELIDFLLFLATGGQRGRSSADGVVRLYGSRPVGVITSIEGVWKEELQNRCVEVEYFIQGDQIKRGPIEREITERRHAIASALMPMLQRYLQIKGENRPTPNPIPQFEEHFTALCNLLRAYGDVAGKASGWADDIIASWAALLAEHDETENELEQPLREVFSRNLDPNRKQMTLNNQPGTLHITTAGKLLRMLRSLEYRDLQLPKNEAGLSRRIKGSRFRSIVVLDETNAPDTFELRRKGNNRPLGIFVADDGVTQNDTAVPATVIQ